MQVNLGFRTWVGLCLAACGHQDPAPSSAQDPDIEVPVTIAGPKTYVLYAPPSVTPLTSALIQVASSDLAATFRCSLNSEPAFVCGSDISLSNLALASHTLEIAAVDEQGHVDLQPAVVQWQVVPLEGNPATAVEVGQGHVCALDTNSRRWCYGNNAFGQLGLNSTSNHTGWATPTESIQWQSLTLGGLHTCGIQSDESLWCWGQSNVAQAGLVQEPVLQPTQMATITRGTHIAAGTWHSCAIDADAKLWCWGFGASGRLGLTEELQTSVPTLVDSAHTYQQVAAGEAHTCAIRTDGTLVCFGSNSDGQLGHVSSGECSLGASVAACSLSAEPLQAGGTWQRVSTGSFHTCAVRSDTTLWCWGRGEYGRLGTELGLSTSTPQQIVGEWQEVAAGSTHTCALDLLGALFCWGDNSGGQLGVTTVAATHLPTSVGPEAPWVTIAAHDAANCGVRQEGSVWCWGTSLFVASDAPVFTGSLAGSLVPAN